MRSKMCIFTDNGWLYALNGVSFRQLIFFDALRNPIQWMVQEKNPA